MLKKVLVVGAAASVAASPSMAAGLEGSYGERRSGAAAGAYFSLPFGGARNGKAQAGLRVQMTYDHRNASAPTAPVVQSNALDLRLVGRKQPTLYVANLPVTGKESRKLNLTGMSTVATVAIVAAAVLGAVLIISAVTDDDDDDRCLDPNLCD